MQIDLTGLAASIATSIFAILTVVIRNEINARIKNRFLNDLLETTVENALGKMQQATDKQIAEAVELHPNIENPLIAVGVNYVLNHAQEAVKGLDTGLVAEKIEAKLGLANIATNLALTQSNLPVAPGPMNKELPVYQPGSMTTEELNKLSTRQ